MIVLLAVAATLPILVYAIWQIRNYQRFTEGIPKFDRLKTAGSQQPSVAVVVPLRNEEGRITTLADGLLSQNFPKLEILFIDDHSSDETLSNLKVEFGPGAGAEFSQTEQAGEETSPVVRILELRDYLRGEETVAHKKAAITYAISRTKADIILTTDADCMLQPDLVANMVAKFKGEVQVVSGPVLNAPIRGFRDNFQALDLASYQFLTAASVAGGTPVLANGACFAFRRQAFLNVGGYAGVDHLPSGDDVLLLHKFRANYGPEQFAWLWHGPVTDTEPVDGWIATWRQRLRWAGKAGSYTVPELKFAQAITYLACLGQMLALVLVLLPLFGSLHLRPAPVLLGTWGLKLVVDYVCLHAFLRQYGREELLRRYLGVAVVYPFFLVAVGTAALLGFKADWKGRST